MGAELSVIVLGVLIALWADGWVEERAERRIEANRVEALGDNVAATRARLQEAIEEARDSQEALATIAGWETAAAATGRDNVIVEGLLFGPLFTPEINVYDDLKNSGDLALLRNTRLRQALAKMDATFDQLHLHQEDLVSVQQLTLDPFVIREFALGPALARFVGLEDVPLDPVDTTVDTRELRNLALFKLDLVVQLLDMYDEAVDALREVEAAMQDGS